VREARLNELREFLPEVDRDLQRFFPFTVEKVSASGDASDMPGTYFVNGLASVYNKWSLDLGGFRERIQPGAFDAVLKTDPHVLHVWDHDTSRTLSSTRNGTLELKSIDEGLHYHSKVAPTTYARDLEILLRRGDIDQSSFAFTVDSEGSEWELLEEDGVEFVQRTILKNGISGLFDVTTCAMGAYPQTGAALAVRSMLKAKREAVPTTVYFPSGASTTATAGFMTVGQVKDSRDSVAPEVRAEEPVAPDSVGGSEQSVAPTEGGDAAAAAMEELADLKRATRDGVIAARNRYHRIKEQNDV
jgi:HK97 family phage prohead protease